MSSKLELGFKKMCWDSDGNLQITVIAKSHVPKQYLIRDLRALIQHNKEPRIHSSQSFQLPRGGLDVAELKAGVFIPKSVAPDKVRINIKAIFRNLNSTTSTDDEIVEIADVAPARSQAC